MTVGTFQSVSSTWLFIACPLSSIKDDPQACNEVCVKLIPLQTVW